jgi:hypothetical protein
VVVVARPRRAPHVGRCDRGPPHGAAAWRMQELLGRNGHFNALGMEEARDFHDDESP